MGKRWRGPHCASAALVLLLPPLFGAAAQSVPEVIRQSIPRLSDPELAPLDIERAAPQRATDSPASAPLIVLRGIDLEGNSVLAPEKVETVIATSIGRNVGLDEIRAIAGDLQALYRTEGYIFNRVLVPLPQDVPDGRVRLIAVEARIGKVTVEEPDSPVGPAVALLGRIGARLDGKLNPRLADIERMILIMNDIPGIKATAIPHPGEGPGVVDISINARREPISGIVFADNRQSAAIGEGLVGVVAEYASWSGDGDSTRVTLANSFWDRASDLTERHLVQLDHARFLSPSGLELRGQILFSLSSPGDSLDVTDIESERTSAELGLRYPVLRTRPWSLWAEGGFEFIESQTDILGSTTIGDDSLRVVTLGGEVLQRDSTGYTLMSAGLRIGLDAFGASEGGDPNLSRNDGSGQFILAQFDATRSQRLYGPFSLLFHAGAQYSADPLLSSEEYSIGGTSFARGLDPGEFTGDSGFGVTLELHYQRDVILLNQSLQTDFYVFGDHGQVWNRAPGAPDHSAVTSVGLGLRLGLPYQSELVTELALPLSGLSETGVPIDDDVRFYLAFQKRF